MIKKAFTLIELVFVIIIIGILFGALGYLSWSYIYKLNVQHDIQTIENNFFLVHTQSLSQPVYKNLLLSKIGIKLEKDKKYFIIVGSTGSNFFPLKIVNLYYLHFGSGLKINGNFYESGIIYYPSYKLGAKFLAEQKVYSTGTLFFSFEDNYTKKCFKINLLVGRLYQTACNY